MAKIDDVDDAVHIANGEQRGLASEQQSTGPKRSTEGIFLVPQPTSDPADPLNWPTWRKIVILATVSLAAFIAVVEATANQTGFVYQAKLYHKTPVEISLLGML